MIFECFNKVFFLPHIAVYEFGKEFMEKNDDGQVQERREGLLSRDGNGKDPCVKEL